MTADALQPRYLGVHLPLLSTERARRHAPPDIAANAPLALIARERGAIVLTAVDSGAGAAGLVTGMTLADARARLPELATLADDPAADNALLEWLADACDRYSPTIMAVPPRAILIDISGCAHLIGGETALVEDLQDRLAKLGLTAWAALASTPDAALALAQFQVETSSALPVEALTGPASTHLALRRAGLATIGDVARQSRPALAARFGAGAIDMLGRLLGETDRRITPRRAPSPIMVEKRFSAPLTQTEAVLQTIEALAMRASTVLAAREAGGRRFEVALYRSDGAVARLAVETAAPLRDGGTLTRLLRDRIDGLADPIDPGFGFDLVRLSVPVLAPQAALQLRLEGGSLAEGEVAALVDRLATRLGRGRVRRLVAADSHIPEQAAFDLPAADAGITPWPGRSSGEPPARPIQLFDPPQPIEVMAEVPDGPPRRFHWRQRLHQVVRHEGPERIAAEWWRRADGAGLTRDYFRVEDSEGQRFWLFRHGLYGTEKPSPGWYLHGVFM